MGQHRAALGRRPSRASRPAGARAAAASRSWPAVVQLGRLANFDRPMCSTARRGGSGSCRSRPGRRRARSAPATAAIAQSPVPSRARPDAQAGQEPDRKPVRPAPARPVGTLAGDGAARHQLAEELDAGRGRAAGLSVADRRATATALDRSDSPRRLSVV